MFGRHIKVRAQEFEHGFFYHREVFHFGHEAVNRSGKVFYEVVIAEFVMGQQVEEAGITLQVGTEIHIIIDDLLQVID